MTTPFLSLTELVASQSQPHVVVNEALRTLEAAINIEVLDKDLTTPPASPATTARYIVAAGATGAWLGQDGNIAFILGDAWAFLTPRNGWQVRVVDESERYEWSGSAWGIVSSGGAALTVADDESPPTEVEDVSTLVFANATVADLGGGSVLVTPTGGGGGSAAEGHGTQTALSISTNAVTMNHALGADFTLSLTANVTTFSHSGVTNGEANWFSLRIAQDGTGGRTFTPPASWIYPSGVSAYTPSSGANDIDLVQGVSYNDGTTWLISYEKDYV
jgi:hypothetical protein